MSDPNDDVPVVTPEVSAPTKASKAKKEEKVMAFETKIAKIKIRGTSPLIVHKWSTKAKNMMLAKQQKKTVAKVAKDPQQDFEDSLYRLPGDLYGFPSIGFKCSAVRAGKGVGLAMTDARSAFRVDGEFVKIDGTPVAREDMVRLETGVADIRYRGQFTEWEAEFTVTYNAVMIDLQQLGVLFNAAGFGVGIGEWRPERNGQYGTFEVVSIEETDQHIYW